MMNLADPELELIDPTPNVNSMFLHFDKTFFWAKLSSRCVVRWSKRMYSCAGICSYEGRGGLCDVALSEPLLKLRPRKDLVETLLHEMIHAYLFVTSRDQDRDGHGPNFQAHMHRINRAAGLNISIYHDFHDEVKLYQTHWWRCNGPCQTWRPYFGIIRRTNNRAPGPTDCWWSSHQRNCGGTFIKIKEPEKPGKNTKKKGVAKPNADITKYINNNSKEVSNKNIKQNDKPVKSVLKDSNNIPVKPKGAIKNNNSSTLVVTKKNVSFTPTMSNHTMPKPKPTAFSGTGVVIGKDQTNNGEHNRTSSAGVFETVRNVWANKQISTVNTKQIAKELTDQPCLINHKSDNKHIESPPHKMKKIDDYFKTAVTSVLKDLYGQDFNIMQSKSDEKLKAIPKNLVDCPICNIKIESSAINRHLDECLNKEMIDKLSKESIPVKHESKVHTHQSDKIKLEEIVDTNINKSKISNAALQNNNKEYNNNNNATSVIRKPPTSSSNVDLTSIGYSNNRKRTRMSFDQDNIKTVEQISAVDKKNINLRKSDSFNKPTSLNINTEVQSKSSKNIMQTHTTSIVKVEPGCSKTDAASETACPCCGDKLNKSVHEHLDECLSFFENNTTIPEEGASTSYINETIIIDDEDEDDDKFDESQTFNATGTKLPCPCCLQMVEEIDMNNHLDECLK